MAIETFESIICPGCSCLCDDIDLVVTDGEITEINNICTWGIGRFVGGKKFAQKKERKRPEGHFIRSEGKSTQVDVEEACKKAASVLRGGERLFFYGLGQSGASAQEKVFRMGKNLDAVFIPSEGPLLTLFLEYSRRKGANICTLEEIRHQADVVVFWGANPIHSCPRLPARYAFFARGRFAERGEEDRKAFIVDLQATELAKVFQQVIIEAGNDLVLLRAVSDLLRGETPSDYGAKPKHVRELAKALQEGSYVAIFCGRGPFYRKDSERFIREMFDLTEILNQERNAVFLPLATDFNTRGFYQILLREGFGKRERKSVMLDVQHWEPESGDVIFALGSDFIWFLSEKQREALKRKTAKIVSISAYETLTHLQAQVAVSCALVGIEVSDVAYRLDGLPFLLKAVKKASFPSDREIMEMIEKEL